MSRSCISIPRGNIICTGGGLTSVANIGAGAGDVFSSISGGDTINLRTLYGSGDTTITTSGDTIVINSSTSGGGGVTSGVNIGTGSGEVFSSISGGDTINLRTLYGSGDTTVTTSGDTIVINSTSGGGSTSPGGTDGQIQYNNAGSFGGSLLYFDDSTNNFGFGCSPQSTDLITICDSRSYNNDNTILDYLDVNSVSQFKIISLSSSLGAAMYVKEIYAYDTGSLGSNTLSINCGDLSRTKINNLIISGNSIVTDSSFDHVTIGNGHKVGGGTDCVNISNILNICPTDTLIGGAEGDIIRLKNHSSCSDGIWVYTGSAWTSMVTW